MDTLLTWNVRNWATVVLMVAVAYAIAAIVLKFYGGMMPQSSANNDGGNSVA